MTSGYTVPVLRQRQRCHRNDTHVATTAPCPLCMLKARFFICLHDATIDTVTRRRPEEEDHLHPSSERRGMGAAGKPPPARCDSPFGGGTPTFLPTSWSVQSPRSVRGRAVSSTGRVAVHLSSTQPSSFGIRIASPTIPAPKTRPLQSVRPRWGPHILPPTASTAW